MRDVKHRDVRRVSRNAPRAKGKELDPGFRRDDEVRAFVGMTKLGLSPDDEVGRMTRKENHEDQTGFRLSPE